jgi:Leucine-rich repeat (LRR) protein
LEGNKIAPSDSILKSNLFTLSKLSVLKNLNLSNNKIQKILLEDIYSLVNAKIEGSENLIFNSLSDLDLSGNAISSINDILELRFIKSLSMLILINNPILRNMTSDEIDSQINL